MTTTLTWTFRDDAFQSEMLPDIEHLGYDYVSEPRSADGYEVLRVENEGNRIAIFFTPTRAEPDAAGLEACLRQLCTHCGLEFLALAPT